MGRRPKEMTPGPQENTEESELFELVELGLTEDIVEYLDNNDVDVDQKNPLGTTPAMVAASRNDLVTLKVLADAGADLSLTDNNNMSATKWAEYNNNQEMKDSIKNYLNLRAEKNAPKKGM